MTATDDDYNDGMYTLGGSHSSTAGSNKTTMVGVEQNDEKILIISLIFIKIEKKSNKQEFVESDQTILHFRTFWGMCLKFLKKFSTADDSFLLSH